MATLHLGPVFWPMFVLQPFVCSLHHIPGCWWRVVQRNSIHFSRLQSNIFSEEAELKKHVYFIWCFITRAKCLKHPFSCLSMDSRIGLIICTPPSHLGTCLQIILESSMFVIMPASILTHQPTTAPSRLLSQFYNSDSLLIMMRLRTLWTNNFNHPPV